jgi:ribonuclease HII
VAALVICESCPLVVKDSKLLSSKQRNHVYQWLSKNNIFFKTEIISARQINNRGIGWANKEVFRRLIKITPADNYIVDGLLKIKKAESIVNADATILPVILAGIVAKVTRDKIMTEFNNDPKFRKYCWHKNKGYGTKDHLELIIKHGMCRYHRTVFCTTAVKRYNHGGGYGGATAD